MALVLTSSSRAMKHRAIPPPVGAGLSVANDDDGDEAEADDDGAGRAALATFMLAMFTLARCKISNTFRTNRQTGR